MACRECRNRSHAADFAHGEVIRLARMMARSERNERRLAGALAEAKDQRATSRAYLEQHESACDVPRN